MKLKRIVSVVLLGSAAASLALAARPQSKQGPDPEEKTPRTVQVKVDRVLHNDATGIGAGKGITILDGDTTVKADDGKWNQKTKVAEATGSLSMSDPQADATSKK